jgi:hypothetical protein
VIALALGGRTVQEWRDTMTPAEFNAWAEFYQAYPFDDMHRIHRPAAMIASSQSTAASVADAIQRRLDWLQPQLPTYEYSDADRRTMRTFNMKPPTGAPPRRPQSVHGEL